MAADSIFYQKFISVLHEKISHKGPLVNSIIEMLDIDKDAAYRRLRGEVSFTFTEICKIAKHLGISIDQIAGIDSILRKPCQIRIAKHVNTSDIDYELFSDYLEILKSVMYNPDTKLMESGNMLPYYLFFDFDYFTRFILFMWNQSSSYADAHPYHKIIIPEQLREIQKECCLCARHFNSTIYVWDSTIFQRLTSNIKYFSNLHFINDEDVLLIKKELFEIIDFLENLTIQGKHKDTGKEISIFISETIFDTNYSVIKSKNLRLTFIKVFLLNASVSLDEDIYNETEAWIRSQKRMSTLITVSGEKIRTSFFETQRKIIDTL